MELKRRFPIALLAACLASLAIAGPQAPKQGEEDRDFTLNVEVDLVQLPVSVAGKEGRIVEGLTRDNFQVFEDGVEQQISLFKHEDVPISIGLVIDNSGSMRNKRERVNSAALTFARESNPEDETFIVDFDDLAYLEQEFTSNIGDLIKALGNIDTRGETALYDALYLSVIHVQEGRRDKKAILLISDGEDTRSKYRLSKVVKALRESKVTLYAIGLLEEKEQSGGLFKKPLSTKAKKVLQQFAEVTGGQAYFPNSLNEVEELCRRVARDLRNHYTIGYSSSNKKRDGSWREVKVRVNAPKNSDPETMTVRTRPGYQAPRVPAATSSR